MVIEGGGGPNKVNSFRNTHHIQFAPIGPFDDHFVTSTPRHLQVATGIGKIKGSPALSQVLHAAVVSDWVSCGRRGQGRVQLQLHQQGEVVGRHQRVGTPDDVLGQPGALRCPEETQHAQVGLAEEDVVDHALKRDIQILCLEAGE